MSGTSLLHGGAPRRASGKHLTDHTEVALLWIDGALGLELGLDDVERTGGNASDETASCASWRGLVLGRATEARAGGVRWEGAQDRSRWVEETYRSCCLRFSKASLVDGAADDAADREERSSLCSTVWEGMKKGVECGEPRREMCKGYLRLMDLSGVRL